jgi:DNA-binding LacI/PurR family transcriptional regulator
VRVFGVDRLDCAERSAPVAECGGEDAAADSRHGPAARLSSGCVCALAAARRSQTIGVLAYDLSDPYCIPWCAASRQGLQPASYLPLLMDAQTQRALFDNYLQMILERRAEGVIVIASWVFDETNLLSDIQKNNVPIVIVSRDLTGRGVSSVLVDNHAGGALAMRHLLELGTPRIAVIRGPEEMFDSAPRWAACKERAAEAGVQTGFAQLVYQLPNLVDPTFGFEGGLDCVRRMLKAARPFTAVLAFDDLTALGVVRGLLDAGVHVPEDCYGVGFDDVLPAAVATPAITTVRQPLREMGLLAAEWVLDAIEAREQKREKTPRLHQRRRNWWCGCRRASKKTLAEKARRGYLKRA